MHAKPEPPATRYRADLLWIHRRQDHLMKVERTLGRMLADANNARYQRDYEFQREMHARMGLIPDPNSPPPTG